MRGRFKNWGGETHKKAQFLTFLGQISGKIGENLEKQGGAIAPPATPSPTALVCIKAVSKADFKKLSTKTKELVKFSFAYSKKHKIFERDYVQINSQCFDCR